MANALDDLLVLELGMAIAVPYCGMLLSDLGARVIKIEERNNAQTRAQGGPIRVRDGQQEQVRIGNYRDRNKESIILDLKSEAGRAAFLGLVARADVVIENFSVGTMDRLGLGYETLKQVNPRLIFAEVSAFGQTGPDATQRGYDILAQARGGYMSVTGYPGNPPTRSGNSISDYYGGLTCGMAILAALRYRDRTGRGQAIDIALMDSLLTAMENFVDDYLNTGIVRTRNPQGNAGYGVYATADGYVATAIGNTQAIWRRFCQVIGQPELLDDPTLATPLVRRQNADVVNLIVADWLKERTTAEVLATLVPAGVPAAKVQQINEIADDPQVQARDMYVWFDHPVYGKVAITGTAFKLSETPGKVRHLAPGPGEHTASVLAELLGYTPEQIAAVQQHAASTGQDVE